MKCPLCKEPILYDSQDVSYECCNPSCVAYYFDCRGKQYWLDLQKQIDALCAKASAPRWRPFDLDEIRRSLPVIVTSKDGSMDYTLLIRNDAEIDIKFRMGFGGWHKEDLVWMPVPKVEGEK